MDHEQIEKMEKVWSKVEALQTAIRKWKRAGFVSRTGNKRSGTIDLILGCREAISELAQFHEHLIGKPRKGNILKRVAALHEKWVQKNTRNLFCDMLPVLPHGQPPSNPGTEKWEKYIPEDEVRIARTVSPEMPPDKWAKYASDQSEIAPDYINAFCECPNDSKQFQMKISKADLKLAGRCQNDKFANGGIIGSCAEDEAVSLSSFVEGLVPPTAFVFPRDGEDPIKIREDDIKDICRFQNDLRLPENEIIISGITFILCRESDAEIAIGGNCYKRREADGN